MPSWEGFAFAVGAAIGHSGIDGSRKLASQRFSSAELVGLVGFLDAFFLTTFVIATGLLSLKSFFSVSVNLLFILAISSILKVLCGVMYQRALTVSPLSVTVPYLAFAPAMILFTSFTLIGEVPSLQGVFGVIIVTIGGYLLALEGGATKRAKTPSSPAALDIITSTPSPSSLESSSAVMRTTSVVSRDPKVDPELGPAVLPGPKKIPALEPEMGADSSAVNGDGVSVDMGLPAGEVDLTPVQPSPERPIIASSPVQEKASLIEKPSFEKSKLGAASGVTQRPGAGDEIIMTGWMMRPRVISRLSDAASRSWSNLNKFSFARLWGLIWTQMGRMSEPLLALRKEEGSVLMLGCAGLLSLTNSFDKMGVHVSPSILVFAALQRIAMAIPSFSYLVATSPKSVQGLVRHFPSLAIISMFEIMAIVCYLKSLDFLLVSYSVATKRTNILVSVMIGKIMFKEKILRRLPYIALMMVGMLFIVFA